MADEVILQVVGSSSEAERILAEFGRRTGLHAEARGDGSHYELHGAEHGTKIIQTLNEIDASWTDHIGLKMPG